MNSESVKKLYRAGIIVKKDFPRYEIRPGNLYPVCVMMLSSDDPTDEEIRILDRFVNNLLNLYDDTEEVYAKEADTVVLLKTGGAWSFKFASWVKSRRTWRGNGSAFLRELIELIEDMIRKKQQ